MKTQVKTIYKIAEPEVKYKTGNSDNKVLLWVVNSDGTILLRNTPNGSAKQKKICELTLEADTLKEILFKIENETGILTSKNNIHHIYSSNDNYDVMFLTVNLDKQHIDVVEDHFKGKFIDYRELMNCLKNVKVTDTCKESLLNLISTLYEKYNLL